MGGEMRVRSPRSFRDQPEDIDTNVPGAEARVLAHPIVQAELARQRRDIDELDSAPAQDLGAVVARLRDRAKVEAASFFGAVS
jgi:hypothetical protein